MFFGEWKRVVSSEFHRYDRTKFVKDLMAGAATAAVALPLALAFGVASGADAAAGLVTAIIAGILIGGFGGTHYQISGPTGAMSAVLIVLVTRYGIEAVWLSGILAGILIFCAGAFRLGRIVALIPSPVITGFTSGIAVIIALGQIDNLMGSQRPPAASVLLQLKNYFDTGVEYQASAVAVGLGVIALMVLWPRLPRVKVIPGSLVAIILSTLCVSLFQLDIPAIGSIPRTVFLEKRFSFDMITQETLGNLMIPAVSIALLGSIESLLSAAVGGSMTGVRPVNNLELMAQGIGNICIPFFGGVPATAAIARTSVAIRSGAVTRLTSILHGLLLLLTALVFAPFLENVPLSALAGVLVVTAYRMNEWHAIRFLFARKLRHGIVIFFVTLFATVLLDLTQAILLGVVLSSMIFMVQVSELQISRSLVDWKRLDTDPALKTQKNVAVYYLGGPLFFAAVWRLIEALEGNDAPSDTVIFSMRGVPIIDATGIETLRKLFYRQQSGGGRLILTGLDPRVESQMKQSGLFDEFGADNIFWSADRAIVHLGAQLKDAEIEPAERLFGGDSEMLEVESLISSPHRERADRGTEEL